mmetsp:Transcript_116031/g.323179  ORF Transcript_116031/g.323179 Transcript_116031/m.323179 type:complete len:214 (+) Transcript_116031:260-901(+)|eukprot:CAMPEP_0179153570 /NCGR_PEP_ID=MMETSP0796-20121207/74688_1 /TAXON_ID=73915 /ORGANISM="Pyrodinium bahamense, Strain pbaha01" /LENGTH=213 /DNA_ID=CAMNT_0020854865 /DNA_START=179 /DNA_END=820 /DNA_ORIENTATION=+
MAKLCPPFARPFLASELREPVAGLHELAQGAGLEARVPCVRDDLQLGLGEDPVEIPGAAGRADDVVAALHDDGGDVSDAVHVPQQLVFGLEPAAVEEVVVLDASEGQCELVLISLSHVGLIWEELRGRALPRGPSLCSRQANCRIFRGQALPVGGDEVAALLLGDGSLIALPLIGEEEGSTLLVVPLQFLPPQHEDTTQHQGLHSLGEGLCIG